MKKLIVVHNSLPSVGKTTFARILENFALDQGSQHTTLVTADRDLPKHSKEVSQLDVDDDYHTIIEHLERNDSVCIDIESGDEDIASELFCDAFFDLMGELEIEMTFAIPYSGSSLCASEVVAIADTFADHADYVVLDGSDPGARDLFAWQGSYAEKVMDYLGAELVKLPLVPEALTQEILESDLSLCDALECRTELPGFAEKAVGQWEWEYLKALEPAAQYLSASAESKGRVLKDSGRLGNVGKTVLDKA